MDKDNVPQSLIMTLTSLKQNRYGWPSFFPIFGPFLVYIFCSFPLLGPLFLSELKPKNKYMQLQCLKAPIAVYVMHLFFIRCIVKTRRFSIIYNTAHLYIYDNITGYNKYPIFPNIIKQEYPVVFTKNIGEKLHSSLISYICI